MKRQLTFAFGTDELCLKRGEEIIREEKEEENKNLV